MRAAGAAAGRCSGSGGSSRDGWGAAGFSPRHFATAHRLRQRRRHADGATPVGGVSSALRCAHVLVQSHADRGSARSHRAVVSVTVSRKWLILAGFRASCRSQRSRLWVAPWVSATRILSQELSQTAQLRRRPRTRSPDTTWIMVMQGVVLGYQRCVVQSRVRHDNPVERVARPRQVLSHMGYRHE